MASDGWFINVGSVAGRQCVEEAALPGWIKPQLTKLVDQPPDGPEWLHLHSPFLATKRPIRATGLTTPQGDQE
jgi:hypothetical protein